MYFSLVAMLLLGLFSTSCKKDKFKEERGDLSFTITQATFPPSRDVVLDSVPECTDLAWSYAKFVLDGDTIKTGLIAMASGVMNTQPLQLDVGFYSVTGFWVYNDNGTPNDESDDLVIRAAPLPGSLYYDLVENSLNIEVEIQAFKKVGYVIDVLCYEELFYEEFGFVWFELNDVVIHQICVFGDVCTTDPSLYEGSSYAQQANGLQMDMPAIFHALIYKGGVLQSTFSNETWLGEGDCLPVWWADDVDLDEDFYLVLKTLLPVGGGFGYVITDSIPIDPDNGSGLTLDDGVLIFEVGNCNDGPGVYGCQAWINLPQNQFDLTLTDMLHWVVGGGDTLAVPANMGTYFTYTFGNIPSGYAVHNGDWPGWCGDLHTNIQYGHPYQATFVSSVQPLPAVLGVTETQANELNWTFNNLQTFFPGLDEDDWLSWDVTHPGEFYELQQAIWMITNGDSSNGHAIAQAIYDSAILHPGYAPPMDGFGLVFIYINDNVQLQLIQLHC